MGIGEIIRNILGKNSEKETPKDYSEGIRLVPIGGIDAKGGLQISSQIHNARVREALFDHLMQHSECMQPSWSERHRPGSEIKFECFKDEIVPEWNQIDSPRVLTNAKMIDVINAHNRDVCENARQAGRDPGYLYTSVTGDHFYGGWGYGPNEYCLILVNWMSPLAEDNFGIGFENLFLERRIYEELIFDKSVPKPDLHCLRWEVKRVTVYAVNDLIFDRVEYVVTGFTPDNLKILQDDVAAHNKYIDDPKGAAEHFQLANKLRSGYRTECWFEISKFFFRPELGKGPMRWDAKPYEDANLKVLFPIELGNMTMTSGCRYETEELGYSLEYVTGNGRTADGNIYCTLYVYTDGKDLPENGISKPVDEHFRTVLDNLINGKDVSRCSEKNGRFRMENCGLDCMWAAFDVHYAQSYEVYSSLLLLTAYRGHFIKLRCSYPKGVDHRLPDGLMPFLEALDNLLKGAA